MTIHNPFKLIEALELSEDALSHADDWLKEWARDKTALNNYFGRATKAMQAIQEAIPIARSLIAELAELREKAEVLKWLIGQFELGMHGFVGEGLAYIKLKHHSLALVSTILNANTGQMGVDTSPQLCPNGCGPMWKVTEREAGNEMVDRMIKERERAETAERLLRESEAREAVMVDILKDVDACLPHNDKLAVHCRELISILPDQSRKLLAVVEAAKEWSEFTGNGPRAGKMLSTAESELREAVRALQSAGADHERQ